jgi:hypothetical protein
VRIDRNITTEVKELARETTSMTVKNKKKGVKENWTTCVVVSSWDDGVGSRENDSGN